MNETTSTPDEPDGRGRVATGEQAAVPQQADGAEVARSAEPGASAGTNGSEPAQAAPAAAAGPSADPPVRQAGAGSDAPTAQLDLSNAPSPAPGAPAEVPESSAPRPSPAPRPRDPEPAPGPVPGPGAEAATPPPWQRMPTPEPAAGPAAAPAPEPHGGLLDEGPTAFLEPPTHRTDGVRGESAASSGSGSWSAVRAVRNRPPRQAALQLKRLDPWSALKLGLVLAVVLFFIWLVAVGVLYGVLDGMGVWDRLNGTYADLVSGDTPTGSPLISAGRVFGFAAVIGAINSLLFAVAVTVGAFVYNVSSDLVGGIEVTLSERD